jgi:hypothetical protein
MLLSKFYTNQVHIFNKETDEKFEKLLNLKNEIKMNSFNKYSNGKKINSNDLPSEFDFSEKDIDLFYMFGKKQYRLTLYGSLAFLSGITYCFRHTLKLYKNSVPIRNSLYSWAGLLFISSFTVKYFESKMNGTIDKEYEDILLHQIFLKSEKKENDNSQLSLLQKQLKVYKSIKRI